MAYNPVLEITVHHWTFSNQFQHLGDQNPFLSAIFPVLFNWTAISNLYVKYAILANQFLILISNTVIYSLMIPLKDSIVITVIYSLMIPLKDSIVITVIYSLMIPLKDSIVITQLLN